MRIPQKILVGVALFMTSTGQLFCQETGFLNRSIHIGNADYRYQVHLPGDFDRTRSWPVILALHGVAQYGRDGNSQTKVGLAPAVRRHPERFPAIIVFPQIPPDGTPGFQGLGEQIALAELDAAVAEFNGDRSRIYLTGLSMGGNGAWYLAYHYPDRFAAMLVVCGFVGEFTGTHTGIRYPPIVPPSAGDPYAVIAQRVLPIPIWIFHGDADPIVPVDISRHMAAALKAAKADVQYTELPGVGHDSWDPAYERADVFVWLFKQAKEPAATSRHALRAVARQ